MTLFEVNNGLGPTLHLLSFLDIRQASIVSKVCKAFAASFSLFLNSSVEMASFFRLDGFTQEEMIQITNNKNGKNSPCEILLWKLLKSPYIRNYNQEIRLDILDSTSLLEFACFRGYSSCVKILLKQSIDMKYVNFSLDCATATGNREVVSMLLKLSVTPVWINKALRLAIHEGFYDVAIELLYDYRSCLNYRDFLFIRMVFEGDPGLTKRLIEIQRRSCAIGVGKNEHVKRVKLMVIKNLLSKQKIRVELLKKKEKKKVVSKKISKLMWKLFVKGKRYPEKEILAKDSAKIQEKFFKVDEESFGERKESDLEKQLNKIVRDYEIRRSQYLETATV